MKMVAKIFGIAGIATIFSLKVSLLLIVMRPFGNDANTTVSQIAFTMAGTHLPRVGSNVVYPKSIKILYFGNKCWLNNEKTSWVEFEKIASENPYNKYKF